MRATRTRSGRPSPDAFGALDVHVATTSRQGKYWVGSGSRQPGRPHPRPGSRAVCRRRRNCVKPSSGHARSQARRYEELGVGRYVSQEMVAGQAPGAAGGVPAWARRPSRLPAPHAEGQALTSQRSNLLVAEVDGIVAVRNADPGTTVVAGQSVVVHRSDTLWINTRFDQVSAHGLDPMPVRIVLRSRHRPAGSRAAGRTDGRCSDRGNGGRLKIRISTACPCRCRRSAEAAEEVTVSLPALAVRPVVLNASVQRVNGMLGVWTVRDGDLELVPVKLGATDLDGNIQVLEGVRRGDRWWILQ